MSRVDWFISLVAPAGEPQATLSPDYVRTLVRVTVRDLADEEEGVLLQAWLEENVGRVKTFDVQTWENDHDCPSCMCDVDVIAKAEVSVVAHVQADLPKLVRGIPLPLRRTWEVAS